MSILKVSQMGHPVLRRVAEPVQPDHIPTDDFQRLIRDMEETMVAYQGAGLAAPQVHVSNRILVYHSSREDGETTELRALINPEVTPASEEIETEWEGCLSIPGIRGMVPRYARIQVTGLDDQGEELVFDAEDFESRVIQHEVDHLDGILYFDRMDGLETLTYLDEYRTFCVRDQDVEELE